MYKIVVLHVYKFRFEEEKKGWHGIYFRICQTTTTDNIENCFTIFPTNRKKRYDDEDRMMIQSHDDAGEIMRNFKEKITMASP